MNRHDFYTGKTFDAYDYFGAHVNEEGVVFRTYAPEAKEVFLMGDFNGWSGERMEQDEKSGIFSIHSRTAKAGQLYKYNIHGKDDSYVEHCDPYGFSMELRPKNASSITDLRYRFHDEKWMMHRDKNYNHPMNIYEMHLGSWKKKEEKEEGWYSYQEIGNLLIPYLLENGYTHIEFLPLSEHPADCSWGYQNTGFFSPTSRYGNPEGLMELVDRCHQNGIGCIMDFVPVHFAIDSYALSRYDGSDLYEYPGNDVGISEWGTCNFNFARGEVRSFLQSAANYWLSKYHFDGLRMDAISRAIYWMGDCRRGINECSVEFIKGMNDGLHKLHPTVMLIAEDSTDFLKVTAPVEYEGLGFDYKWDMGWMNDTLEYFKMAPEERPKHYHKLTFSMHYFYNELFLLPLSHDESVHGKATVIQKMWGEYEDKFRQCRAFYLYMYTHPGKKLNFMGNEFAQFREWDERREQDFDILKFPMHDVFYHFMKKLNSLYKQLPALHEKEYNKEYFQWLVSDAEADSVYAYQRGKGKKSVIAIFNFSGEDRKEYPVHIKDALELEEIFNTDWEKYGGETKSVKKKKIKNMKFDLKKFSGRLFRIVR